MMLENSVFFLEKEENNFGKCGTSQMTIDHKVYCISTQITSHFFEIVHLNEEGPFHHNNIAM